MVMFHVRDLRATHSRPTVNRSPGLAWPRLRQLRKINIQAFARARDSICYIMLFSCLLCYIFSISPELLERIPISLRKPLNILSNTNISLDCIVTSLTQLQRPVYVLHTDN